MITTAELNQLKNMWETKIRNEEVFLPDFPDWMDLDDANRTMNLLCKIITKGVTQIERMRALNEADRKNIEILRKNNLSTDTVEHGIRIREFAITVSCR